LQAGVVSLIAACLSCRLSRCRSQNITEWSVLITLHFCVVGNPGKFCAGNGRVQIILDPAQPETRKRVTILHELGHYLLGHLDAVPLAVPGDSTAWHPAECAAEQFAIGVLMPACVLWGLDIHTPVDIASVCNVSQRAARMRAERMETLYRQDGFLTHPLECQVYSQFHAFFRAAKKEKTTLSGQSGL